MGHNYITPDKLAELTNMIRMGMTFSQIASVTGRTRSSVAGAVYRAGLATKRPPPTYAEYVPRQRAMVKRMQRTKTATGEILRKRAEDRAKIKQEAITMNDVPLIGPLTCEGIPADHHCRWIEDNASGKSQWCGQPVTHGVGRSFERSYCAKHLVRMVNVEVKTVEEKDRVQRALAAIRGGVKFGVVAK